MSGHPHLEQTTAVRCAVIRVALLCLACVAAFAAGETVLSFYKPFELVVRGDRIVLPANREYVFRRGDRGGRLRASPWIAAKLDPVIVHRKNRLGFRGEEPPASFADYLTIITVGGSTTECFYLSDGSTWSDRLAGALHATFSRVWVNNAGLDGHSTFGHTVLLEDHIAALRPKVTLFLVGINDLHAQRPLEADRRVQRAGLDLSSPTRLLVSAANYSDVIAVALNVYRHVRAETMGLDYQTDFDLRTAGMRRVTDDQWAAARREYSGGLAAYRRRLEDLVSISRRNGIEPVLLTQPVLYGGGVDDQTGVNLETVDVRGLNGEVMWEVLELYNDATRDVGARQGVHVIDLARSLEKSSRFFYDFHHFTTEGAERVAKLVYDSLCPFLARKYPDYLRGSCGEAPLP